MKKNDYTEIIKIAIDSAESQKAAENINDYINNLLDAKQKVCDAEIKLIQSKYKVKNS